MKNTKNIAISILRKLYENKYSSEEYDYETVDDFYAFLGYDLEMLYELELLNISGTSDLQELLLK